MVQSAFLYTFLGINIVNESLNGLESIISSDYQHKSLDAFPEYLNIYSRYGILSK